MTNQKKFDNAEWIFVKDIPKDVCNGYFDYQSEFQAEKGKRTELYLSACSLYAVYINGQFVDCGQYPGYEDYQVYDTLDITSYLVEGENTLFITQYVIGADIFTHRILIPGVIFTIWQEDTCVLNSTVECLSRVNPYYISGEMERVTLQLGYTFKYDALKEETAFCKSVLAGKEKSLYERPIKKLPIEQKITGTLKNQGVFQESGRDKQIGKIMLDSYLASRTKEEILSAGQDVLEWDAATEDAADGVYFIFDAGEESVGFLSLDFEVPEACEVLIGYGEHLEDLRVRSFVRYRNFCGSYHAKAGRNQFFYPFLRLGMRYLQVHIYHKRGKLFHAGIKKTYYPLQIKECTLQDALHKKIYEVCIRTLHHCMHEHHEDCPWREQALYTVDSRVQMICGYYAFEEYEFAKESLRLMARSLREDGTLELCAPGKVPITIPFFTISFVRQVKEYLDYSRDKAFVEEIFASVKAIVLALEKRLEDNDLLTCFEGDQYWNFYEWTDSLDGREYFKENAPFEAPLNASVSDAFYCFARICDIIEPTAAAYYDNLHQRVNQALHKMFYDENRHAYVTRQGDGENKPLHAFTQALVLYAGAVPEELKPEVIENMISGNLVPCTLSSTIYEFDVLLREGNQYWSYVKNEVEKRWGAMLYAGATTFWETDKGQGDFGNAGSLCHGWAAVPVYLYGKYHLVT